MCNYFIKLHFLIQNEFFDLAEKHFLDAYFYFALPEHVVKVTSPFGFLLIEILQLTLLDCQSYRQS